MAKIHRTVSGETFDMLALRYYDEEKLASIIIQANPDYCDVLIFESVIEIIIPDAPEASFPETLPPWRRNE